MRKIEIVRRGKGFEVRLVENESIVKRIEAEGIMRVAELFENEDIYCEFGFTRFIEEGIVIESDWNV